MSADGDVKRFHALRHTGPAMRLKLAVREGNLALAHIDAARRRLDERRAAAWQRRYILCCDNASRAIEELSEQFGWPTDGAAARGFIWIPKAARRWLWQAPV